MADAAVEAAPNMANMDQEPEPTTLTANGKEAIDNTHTEDAKDEENADQEKTDEVMEDAKDKGDRGRDSYRPHRDSGRGRGRGRGNHYYKPPYHKGEKVKTDYVNRPETSDADEIRRQVEFYFSDANLPVDEYLLRLTGGSENKPVPLKTIHDFKRMKQFQPFSAICEAIKESNFLDLDANNEITRKTPLDAKFGSDANANRKLLAPATQARSAYAKGFGQETATSVYDIEAFFQPWGVKQVRLRRKDDGYFKGSVFVEFNDEETLKRFLESEPKPTWDGRELIIMSKTAYIEMKCDSIKDGSVKPREQDERSFGGRRDNRDRGDWGRGRGNRYSKGDKFGRRGGDRRGGRDRDRDRDRDDKHRRRSRFDHDEEDWRERRDREKKEEAEKHERNKRQPSPDGIDNLKRKRGDEEDKDVPTRAEAEAKKAKVEQEDEKAETKGGAEDATAADAKPAVESATTKTSTNGKEAVESTDGGPAPETKKRARDEASEGNEQHETKKVKADGGEEGDAT